MVYHPDHNLAVFCFMFVIAVVELLVFLFVCCLLKKTNLFASEQTLNTNYFGIFVGSEVPKCQNFKFQQNGNIIHNALNVHVINMFIINNFIKMHQIFRRFFRGSS